MQRLRKNPFVVVIIAATVLFSGIVVWGIYDNQQNSLVWEPAPNFSLVTYNGKRLELTDFKGQQVIVLNFWQSNCGPCRQEAPTLEATYRRYATQEVVFLGVNGNDANQTALDFLETFDITYPNGDDSSGAIQEKYRIHAYPQTFIIDRNGIIIYHHRGAISENELIRQLEDALSIPLNTQPSLQAESNSHHKP